MLDDWVKDKQEPCWTEEQLQGGMIKAFKAARGAAGIDGWHGDEINSLPEVMAVVFYTLTRKWRQQRRTPQLMSYIRQTALQKPCKPALVENLRPLSIMSAFWPTFESSAMRTEGFAQWRDRIGCEGVAFTQSAEEVAAIAATLFAEYGFLGALDYS